MWGAKPVSADNSSTKPAPIASIGRVDPDDHGSPACCGKPMAPQFRHARDPDGQMLFVAVWRCSECGRITF
jgi:hypothetical protein